MTNRGDVKLGDDAKDTISGFRGIVVAVTDWLNGGQRITIQPQKLDAGKPIDSHTFDVEQIEVVKAAKPVVKKPTGGPHDEPRRQAGPTRS